jgi:hypothetical protein
MAGWLYSCGDSFDRFAQLDRSLPDRLQGTPAIRSALGRLIGGVHHCRKQSRNR